MEDSSFIHKYNMNCFEFFTNELGLVPVYENFQISISTKELKYFIPVAVGLDASSMCLDALKFMLFYLSLPPSPSKDPNGVDLLFKATQEVCGYSWQLATEGFYYEGEFFILTSFGEDEKIAFAQSLMDKMILVAKRKAKLHFA